MCKRIILQVQTIFLFLYYTINCLPTVSLAYNLYSVRFFVDPENIAFPELSSITPHALVKTPLSDVL